MERLERLNAGFILGIFNRSLTSVKNETDCVPGVPEMDRFSE